MATAISAPDHTRMPLDQRSISVSVRQQTRATHLCPLEPIRATRERHPDQVRETG